MKTLMFLITASFSVCLLANDTVYFQVPLKDGMSVRRSCNESQEEITEAFENKMTELGLNFDYDIDHEVLVCTTGLGVRGPVFYVDCACRIYAEIESEDYKLALKFDKTKNRLFKKGKIRVEKSKAEIVKDHKDDPNTVFTSVFDTGKVFNLIKQFKVQSLQLISK